MLWSRRATLAGLAALPLAACGFTPVYGPSGPGTALRGRVAVDAPENRLGFEFVARMEERLGRVRQPDYRLSYTISEESQGIAISSTNDITRVRLNGRVQYTLVDASGAQLLAGEVENFTAYSTTGSTLASDAGARDAETRLMVLLADQVVDRLISGAARFS